jgi:hypothetical protein
MTKLPVSNVLRSAFERVASDFQRVALASAAFFATLCDVLQNRRVARRVALKVTTAQCLVRVRNSATLLLSYKEIVTYVYTYACAYRGNIGSRFEMLRPRCEEVVS